MNFFNHVTTARGPLPKLRIHGALWRRLLQGLRERGGGIRESGAFILGRSTGPDRMATQFVLYDDLDPDCLNEGYVRFDGRYYARLWEICRDEALSVVADVHTHPYGPGQSDSDRAHPMISIAGHVALIVPNYAQHPISATDLGVYVYRGKYRWTALRGNRVLNVLAIETEGVDLWV